MAVGRADAWIFRCACHGLARMGLAGICWGEQRAHFQSGDSLRTAKCAWICRRDRNGKIAHRDALANDPPYMGQYIVHHSAGAVCTVSVSDANRAGTGSSDRNVAYRHLGAILLYHRHVGWGCRIPGTNRLSQTSDGGFGRLAHLQIATGISGLARRRHYRVSHALHHISRTRETIKSAALISEGRAKIYLEGSS